MSVQVAKGAVQFKSIMAMARSIAKQTQEPVSRVYIRTWKRINEAGMTISEAYHTEKRKYEMQVQEQITA
jgi:hypothetical protein